MKNPKERILVTYLPDNSTVSIMRKQFDGCVHKLIENLSSNAKEDSEVVQVPKEAEKPLDVDSEPPVVQPKGRLEVLKVKGWANLTSADRKEYQLLKKADD